VDRAGRLGGPVEPFVKRTRCFSWLRLHALDVLVQQDRAMIVGSPFVKVTKTPKYNGKAGPKPKGQKDDPNNQCDIHRIRILPYFGYFS